MSAPPFHALPPGGRAPDRLTWVETQDGVRLRAARWTGTGRGHAVLLTGRTEYLEKAAIPAAELVARGFDVVSLDWRGQGLSSRLLPEPLKGHVQEFSDYRRDLAAVMADPIAADLPGQRLMLAHSMGGAIGLGALTGGTIRADAAIFSAPMVDLALSPPLRLAARVTGWIGARIGREAAWPPFGSVREPYCLSPFADNVLTSDQAVWNWMAATLRAHPALGLGQPTLRWFRTVTHEIRALARIETLPCPALFVVGTGEKVVSAPAIKSLAGRTQARLAEIPGARHEPLIEAAPLRLQVWTAIDAFLAGTFKAT